MIVLILQNIFVFFYTGVGSKGWGCRRWGISAGGTSAVLTPDRVVERLGWNASLFSLVAAPCQNKIFWRIEIYICIGPTIYLCVIS